MYFSVAVTVPPTEESEAPLSEDVPFYYNLKVIIIVFVSSSIFTTLVATAAFIRRKSKWQETCAVAGVVDDV